MDEDVPGGQTPSYQVFKLLEPDAQDERIDGRAQITLTYIGRIVQPAEAHVYWSPRADDVGKRYGEGKFVLLPDEAIQEWKEPGCYQHSKPIYMDVVAETEYYERQDIR